MTDDQAIELARRCAVDCEERHEYMPATPLLAEVWQPHRWVLDAIQEGVHETELARDAYRNGNTALLDALMCMVWQFVGVDDRDGVISHTGMAAEEAAIKVLMDAGVAEQLAPGANSYRLLWAKLEERKPKQQTWAEAVRECITDPAEVERLLALDDNATSAEVHAAASGADSEGGEV
jgi:hypothetical protein